jgi:four helix bundle protein
VTVRSYRDLIVWQKSIELVNAIYAATRSWPSEERYALTSQIRRAAVSVPSNIAEGQGRSSTNEFLKHLSIAYGSLMETETQITVAHEQGSGTECEFRDHGAGGKQVPRQQVDRGELLWSHRADCGSMGRDRDRYPRDGVRVLVVNTVDYECEEN